jgi:CheY-like chemotaxis protein
MQSHNGLIDVRSELGNGTSIALYFPIPDQPPAQSVACPRVAPKSVEGTETVLIVDDEPDVCYFLEIILKAHGYDVLSARNAETALKLFPPPPGKIDLLFSDVGLPTIDGFELCRRARQIQPQLKTILCSGYADGRLKTRMAEEGVDGFVPKPYDTSELLQTIRGILDKEVRK